MPLHTSPLLSSPGLAAQMLRQGPVTSSIGRCYDWKIDGNIIRRGKEDRMRLLMHYISSIFSEVGRIANAQGRYGISHTQKGL